jgi:hypothetical protein
MAPTEREISRRTFLKAGIRLTGAILAAPLLSVCARPEEPGQTLPRSAATVTPWKPDAPPPAPTARPKSPPEAQKPAASEVKLSKKPEELFKILLTTPFSNDKLPPGFTSKGSSAGNLDATLQALKAVGQVNILVSDNDPRFFGMPNGGIVYNIFPDNLGANQAYDISLTHLSNPRTRPLLNGTITVGTQSTFGGPMHISITLVKNVLIASTLTLFDKNIQEARTIDLAQAGVEHLVKVGR